MYADYPGLTHQLSTLSWGHLLEFGCGDGGFLKYVLELNSPVESIVAIDINPQAVARAQEVLAEYSIRFTVERNLPLSFESDWFDTITLTNTLHHLEHKGEVLTEVQRVLKSNGQIIITEMISNDLSFAEQAYCRFHALRAEIDVLRGQYHDRTYTSEEILSLIVDSGLKIKESEILECNQSPDLEPSELAKWLGTIDELVESQRQHPEYPALQNKAESIKAQIRSHGLIKPRQIFIKTGL